MLNSKNEALKTSHRSMITNSHPQIAHLSRSHSSSNSALRGVDEGLAIIRRSTEWPRAFLDHHLIASSSTTQQVASRRVEASRYPPRKSTRSEALSGTDPTWHLVLAPGGTGT